MWQRAVTNTIASLSKLASEVERGFEQILARHRDSMECRPGCTDCCRCRLSVTRVEEAFIRDGLSRLPVSARQELKRRSTAPSSEMCPALDDDGRCQIYESRPLICRSFGAPLRYRYPVPLIHPSQIDVCDKNFTETDTPKSGNDVLDQTSLNEALAAIDDAYCTERGLPRGERVPLAQILTDST